MEPKYNYIASSLTTEELIERINNRQKYMPDTVEATVKELQYRKHEFSDAELRNIDDDIFAQRKKAVSIEGRIGAFNTSLKNVIVKDPDAPLVYSRRAVYVFTILCGALFGSVLLAININKISKSVNAFWVLLFGVAFTTVQIYVLNKVIVNSSGAGVYLFAFTAAYIIDFAFWKRYIGYSTFYRAKPVWIPLIIAVFVYGLIFFAMFYASQH